MLKAVLVAVGLLAASEPSAEWQAEDQRNPTARYTGDTTVSIVSGGGITSAYNATNVGFLSANGQFVGLFSVGVDLRISVSGFLLEPSFGFAVAGGFGAGGVSSGYLAPGLGLGYGFALSPTVALSPMVRGTLVVPTGGGYSSAMVGTLGAELPLTVFLGRNGFMEPYLFTGAYVYPGPALIIVTVGYRLGVTF